MSELNNTMLDMISPTQEEIDFVSNTERPNWKYLSEVKTGAQGLRGINRRLEGVWQTQIGNFYLYAKNTSDGMGFYIDYQRDEQGNPLHNSLIRDVIAQIRIAYIQQDTGLHPQFETKE